MVPPVPGRMVLDLSLSTFHGQSLEDIYLLDQDLALFDDRAIVLAAAGRGAGGAADPEPGAAPETEGLRLDLKRCESLDLLRRAMENQNQAVVDDFPSFPSNAVVGTLQAGEFYHIYTSGTTGQPKAVVGTLPALETYLRSKFLDRGPGSRVGGNSPNRVSTGRANSRGPFVVVMRGPVCCAWCVSVGSRLLPWVSVMWVLCISVKSVMWVKLV